MPMKNLNEHLNCSNYRNDPKNMIFTVHRKEKDFTLNYINVYRSKVIFLVNGEITICINNNELINISDGNIVFLPTHLQITMHAITNITFLSCEINELQFCNRYGLTELQKDAITTGDEELSGTILPMRGIIRIFASCLIEMLEEGLSCIHLHEIKYKEFFILMRAYYTKIELHRFFSYEFSNKKMFRHKVLNNYHKVKGVKELAELNNMAIATFYRCFKQEFKQSPADWLDEKKKERVYYAVHSTAKSLEDIADEFGFSSVSHLSLFCKRKFLKSPREIRFNCD